MLIKKKNKVAQTYNKRIKRKIFEVGELVGILYYQLVPKTKNWANGLPTRRDLSKCIKYCLEMHIGWQIYKESHTRGSFIGNT